jgi:hypothetical protein
MISYLMKISIGQRRFIDYTVAIGSYYQLFWCSIYRWRFAGRVCAGRYYDDDEKLESKEMNILLTKN